MSSASKHPGVYVNEVDAFPNAVAQVATAVPAFIGYTPRAELHGKACYNTPIKVTSFDEFKAVFLLPNPPPPADPARQYSPEYYLVPQTSQPTVGQSLTLSGHIYSVLPDPDTVYFMVNSVRLFFQNGGGTAYIVAVGGYGPASGRPLTEPAKRAVNANVKLPELLNGLSLLKNEAEPTMYLCPEATLLAPGDNATLMRAMLKQASEMQTALCLFDVIGGAAPDPSLWTQDIQAFRAGVGAVGLKYGAAYYPFIGTNVMQPGEIDFTNLFGGDTARLAPLLSPPSDPNPRAAQILDTIQHPPADPQPNSALNAALMSASPTYQQIIGAALASANVLPPSGGMAGVYAVHDNTTGVWNSPANVAIVGAESLTIQLSDTQQAGLNVDSVSGKSVNAIRVFSGKGILVWGARTLDGNSQDWRYISVCRTAAMIRQSVKAAMKAYVFLPNTSETWTAVKTIISSFLTNLWQQGALQGASSAAAFNVSVGLGSTMTAADIANGILRVKVQVAVLRPAEFIVIALEQQQAASG